MTLGGGGYWEIGGEGPAFRQNLEGADTTVSACLRLSINLSVSFSALHKPRIWNTSTLTSTGVSSETPVPWHSGFANSIYEGAALFSWERCETYVYGINQIMATTCEYRD